jgi:polyphenol oxidase
VTVSESGRPGVPGLIRADWPAPPGVQALTTTRHGGVSRGPFASCNLAMHTGDRAGHVMENRARLRAVTGVAAMQWLHQVHGTGVVRAYRPVTRTPPRADAVWTSTRELACAVLTADCLPVLLCDRNAAVVAAAHAGWRGLVQGVLAAVVTALPVPPSELMAWLGPGISGPNYEVGDDVHGAVRARHGDAVAQAVLTLRDSGKWSFDLPLLARLLLARVGVREVHGGGFCTLTDPAFYSFRRDGETGRMASMIWLTA